MLQHIAVIKFKQGTDVQRIEELKEKLSSLPKKIIEIKSYIFGTDILKTTRSMASA